MENKNKQLPYNSSPYIMLENKGVFVVLLNLTCNSLYFNYSIPLIQFQSTIILSTACAQEIQYEAKHFTFMY